MSELDDGSAQIPFGGSVYAPNDSDAVKFSQTLKETLQTCQTTDFVIALAIDLLRKGQVLEVPKDSETVYKHHPSMMRASSFGVFSFEPFLSRIDELEESEKYFSSEQRQRAIKLVAVIIAHSMDPVVVYRRFISTQATSSMCSFRPFRSALEMAFGYARIRRHARIIALCQLLDTGRIVAKSESQSSDIMSFCNLYRQSSRDVKGLLMKQVLLEAEAEENDGIERVVAKDTISVWMRCTVTERKSGELMVHYENWTDKWNEWLPENSDRVEPWISPQQPIGILRPVSEVHVRSAMLDIFELLRSARWLYFKTFV